MSSTNKQTSSSIRATLTLSTSASSRNYCSRTHNSGSLLAVSQIERLLPSRGHMSSFYRPPQAIYSPYDISRYHTPLVDWVSRQDAACRPRRLFPSIDYASRPKSTLQQNDDFSSLHNFPFSRTGVLGNHEPVAFLRTQ
jgi:hypothetical protein